MTAQSPETQAAYAAVTDMVQRQALRIAALPKEEREEHFESVRQSLEEAAVATYPDNPNERAELIDLMMKTIRALVLEIDAGSRSGKGGTA